MSCRCRPCSDIGQGVDPASPRIAGYIRSYLELPETWSERFCRQFTIDARAPALLRLTHLFGRTWPRYCLERRTTARCG